MTTKRPLRNIPVDASTEGSIEEQHWGAEEGLFNLIALPSVDDGAVHFMTPDQRLQWQDHVHRVICASLICAGAAFLRRGLKDNIVPTPSCSSHFAQTTEGCQYFLVGVLHVEVYPIMLQVKMLKTRRAAEICARLGEMLAFFKGIDSMP